MIEKLNDTWPYLPNGGYAYSGKREIKRLEQLVREQQDKINELVEIVNMLISEEEILDDFN